MSRRESLLSEIVLPPSEFELVRGVPRIRDRMAELLNWPQLTQRQVYWFLEEGHWPGTRQSGKWQLRPARLLEEIRAAEDEALRRRRDRLAAAKAAKAGDGEQAEPPEPPQAERPRGRPRRGADKARPPAS